MPVLARRIEAAGLPTVVVTMMPSVADALLTPRIVGVEFPFGHAFGMPGDSEMQRQVLLVAARQLAGAPYAGARIDLDIEWPVPVKEAYRTWQPAEASPLVAQWLQSGRPS